MQDHILHSFSLFLSLSLSAGASSAVMDDVYSSVPLSFGPLVFYFILFFHLSFSVFLYCSSDLSPMHVLTVWFHDGSGEMNLDLKEQGAGVWMASLVYAVCEATIQSLLLH